MFRKNTRHRQIPLTSHVDEMPAPLRERLPIAPGRKPFIGNSFVAWMKRLSLSCMPMNLPVRTYR
jgi:hypothetical protein